MKAIVLSGYGSPQVAKIKEIEIPKINENEILVKVSTAAVTAGDSRIRGARFPAGMGILARIGLGIFKPRNKVLGISFAGIVSEVGKNVKSFKEGDRIMGMSGFKMGAHAEYLKVNENKAIIKTPENINDIDAAGVSFGGTTAYYFLVEKGKIQEGQKVLINGASGAVGTNAVQIAKYFGANVAAVCGTDNLQLVKDLGADIVIDYKKESIFKDGDKYDLILDMVGNLSIDKVKNYLTENGSVILGVASLGQMLMPNKKVIVGTSGERKSDLENLVKMMSEGKLNVVIDKVFKMEEIVEAYKRADSGHKVGNVILKIN